MPSIPRQKLQRIAAYYTTKIADTSRATVLNAHPQRSASSALPTPLTGPPPLYRLALMLGGVDSSAPASPPPSPTKKKQLVPCHIF